MQFKVNQNLFAGFRNNSYFVKFCWIFLIIFDENGHRDLKMMSETQTTGSIRADFTVSGHVQGVGFRYFVYTNANLLKLKGFAKNDHDGTVRVCVEGSERTIAALHELLWQGPSRSYIKQVTVNYSQCQNEFLSFNIK